jgi:ABC-type sugar transport system substrate-binding protein
MNRKTYLPFVLVLLLTLVLSSCASPAPKATEPPAPPPTEAPAAAPMEEPTSAPVAEEAEASPMPEKTMTLWQKTREETLAGMVGFEKPTKKDMRIGVLMITMANPFWVTFAEGAQSMGKELGITVDIQSAPTEGDISSQLATCESMVAAGYDAMVIYPITENNLIPCIVKANNAGVPIVEPNIISDIKAVEADGGKITQPKTLDFFNQGVLGAQYIVDQIGAEGGKVAIIEGLAAAPQSMARRDGAKSIFENTPGIEPGRRLGPHRCLERRNQHHPGKSRYQRFLLRQ